MARQQGCLRAKLLFNGQPVERLVSEVITPKKTFFAFRISAMLNKNTQHNSGRAQTIYRV